LQHFLSKSEAVQCPVCLSRPGLESLSDPFAAFFFTFVGLGSIGLQDAVPELKAGRLREGWCCPQNFLQPCRNLISCLSGCLDFTHILIGNRGLTFLTSLM
jgi:hypothetical protein